MRVLVATESFLPSINGVTNSVLRILEHLATRGHTATVVAPSPAADGIADAPTSYAGAAVRWLPSVALPGYRSFRVSMSGVFRARRLLDEFQPDIVHLASPFVLGWDVVRAAQRSSQRSSQRVGPPVVAAYQTEVPTYAGRYGVPQLEPLLWQRVRDIHGRAALTLAPSGAAAEQLRQQQIPRVTRWGRGVDLVRFSPANRDEAWRSRLLAAGRGSVLVGYVGRLAAEKQVADLTVLAALRRVQLVVIGDGPLRARLERALPSAIFLGFQQGADLSRAVAGLDVMVHPGEHETFGQTIQEAMASGVPVVSVAAGGPLDLVIPGRTGLLYPPGDLGALRDGVDALARSPFWRQQLGRTARREVDGRTWSAVCDELIGHYTRVLHPAQAAA